MPTPLDSVANSGLTARLKAEGFRKAGRTWRRQFGPDGAVHIVNLQGSMFSTRAQGRCALNVAIYFPVLAELLGIGAPTDVPAEAVAHLRRRAATLLREGRDDWFDFAAEDTTSIS